MLNSEEEAEPGVQTTDNNNWTK